MKIKKIWKSNYNGIVFNIGNKNRNYFADDILVHNCYMDSKTDSIHYENVLNKIRNFFGQMTENQRPFQIAYGGGEPTEHPEFLDILKLTYDLDITPNYTTNGSFIFSENKDKIIEYTKKYCGGVAVSCHEHLNDIWTKAANLFIDNGIKTNFHIIISDKDSIDRFIGIYNEWKYKIDYFVLLPQINKGRSKDAIIDWEYLKSVLPENKEQIAFGANFYPYLKDYDDIGCDLYEPEIMSKFLDLKDMRLYGSSFEL
jgi:organic radical activating enzyme